MIKSLVRIGALALPLFVLATPRPVIAKTTAPPSPQATLTRLADAFVPLVLEIGTYEPDFVDAYYGPADLRTKAEAKPRSRGALEQAASAAVVQLDRSVIPHLRDPAALGRAKALRGFYRAAAMRLAMIGGKRFPFDQEALGLFAVKPQLKPLSYYDAILAKLDRLVPGDGPLAARVDAFNDRFIVPKDRLRPVMEAAIAECRRRTLAYFDLPKEESFDLEFVTGKSWSGYNYYKGNYHSLIQVNTDLPVRIGRAVDLGCHEGYPGHHVLNIMIERNLVRGKGWHEYWVNPLYAPQSLISEGSANYGIDLAFPGEEQLAFERDTLFPLAGLDPSEAKALWDVRKATTELGASRMTLAKLYLDGTIDRAKTLELFQKYQLTTQKRAEQGIAFFDQYRSYTINYYLGQDLVRGFVERGKPDAKTRWARMRHVLSDTVMPMDLVAKPAR
ncbi:hypothetical protein [Sphingobium nicotianae]|uniref:DUF885 domain-containing protein n=1 Tax=Sphingobium nicotianae TaxID=2782607 RepID=A0A9X1DEG7_9SPHN|nr:hypothetical protein [Sphingobium nicotianae]MBT2188394.1 hypothetical protein [Sphingobium nicotianae]